MMDKGPVGIAFVGCGFVADFYRHCLAFHTDRLRLAGIYDHDAERLAAFAGVWGDKSYASLKDVLSDEAVSIVVNLTSPESHAAITAAAIEAGRHVYSEKPLAMTVAEAYDLRDAAARRGVQLAGAPANLLGEQAQTLWRAVRQRLIGDIRLVYAELDDGMIHKAPFRQWISRSGRPWPAESEFETGCTFEHAGYILTLLAAMFGPARRVTAFSALLAPNKLPGMAPVRCAPDFSVGLIEFDGGIVARLTNSIVAPYDHRLRIIGEDGVLEVAEPWDYAAPVRLRRTATTRLGRFAERRFGGLTGRVVPPARKVPFRGGRGKPTMDFMRGVRDLAEAIGEGRCCRTGADFAVHITEVTEILQYPHRFAHPAHVMSEFAQIEPMPWAR